MNLMLAQDFIVKSPIKNEIKRQKYTEKGIHRIFSKLKDKSVILENHFLFSALLSLNPSCFFNKWLLNDNENQTCTMGHFLC